MPIIPTYYAKDNTLSWGARGLFSYLLSKSDSLPDKKTIVISELIDQTKESAKPTGRDDIYSLLNELIAAGYIVRTQSRIKGKMSGYHYEFKLYKREAALSSNVIF